MKDIIKPLLFCLLAAVPAQEVRGQTVSFEFLGPGCAATYAYPWVNTVNNTLNWYGQDPSGAFICATHPGDVHVLVAGLPAAAPVVTLPSYYTTPCEIHVLPVALFVIPASRCSRSVCASQVLGTIEPGWQFSVQGVFVLNTFGIGATCPPYLSATAAWRVRT